MRGSDGTRMDREQMNSIARPVKEISLEQLSAELASGRRSPVGLTADYLARIAELDRDGPRLRSVIETNPDALEIAIEMKRELQANRRRGPLHGVPILIKDNIDTSDAMSTTAGSLAMSGVKPSADAIVVTRLRASGAVLLGKTNMSEWANARGAHGTGGWSARGGLTRNPYVLDRSASGSSSGSAVAVAASLCAAAVGTETDGSILCPAAVCGVVGLKPTVGLVSRTGVIPLANSQDTPGPIARNVRDCALLLDAMAGADPQDPATLAAPDSQRSDYAGRLDPSTLHGCRLGLMEAFLPAHAGIRAAYESALSILAKAGATLVRITDLPDLALMREHERFVMLTELKAGLNDYLGRAGAGAPRNIKDLTEFNKRHSREEMPWFQQERLEQAERMPDLSAPEYLFARQECLRLAKYSGIDALIGAHGLDALIAPTTQPAGVIDLALGDPAGIHSCTMAAVAGTPGITVPAGHWLGLPLGLSFYGQAWQEQRLLNLALGFEQISAARQAPTYRKSIEDNMPAIIV